MVATERIKLAETEEELKELRMEKEALKRALRLIEGENHTLRESNALAKLSSPDLHEHDPPIKASRSRSSSEVAIKSRPGSFMLESSVPLPPSPAPEGDFTGVLLTPPHIASQSQAVNDPQVTPKRTQSLPLSSPRFPTELEGSSPWADASPPSTSVSPSPAQAESDSIYATATLAMR